MVRLLRNEDGLWPNLLALSYAFGGYAAGLWLILQSNIGVNIVGVVLLGHSLVIAAYLIHECAHNTIFRKNRYNAWLGEALMWLVGASYSRYEDIRHKHFRHHVDRADVVAFDFRPALQRWPRLLRLIHALEWCYLPAVDIMMHGLILVLPFTTASRRDRRARVLVVLLLRTAWFAALAAVSPRVLLLYPISYMIMLTVLRYMDAHQHTYELFATLEHERGPEAKRFDREYEQRNTYSNLISERHPWLNLLVLNFPYHNAHHERPIAPWHRLPSLHHELFGDHDRQVLPLGSLLRAYHRYRVARVLNADPAGMDVYGDRSADFIGVDGVSFLIAH
jgi:fatty acid desaturase